MERDAKHRSLDQLAASHSHPSAVLNGWRDAVDLSRVPDGTSASSTPFSMSTNIPKLGTVNALQGSLGMDLSGILQAGLIHPVTGQIVNGSLRRDDAAIRRRRGRRKNVEGIDLILLKERSLQTGLPVSTNPYTHLLFSVFFGQWTKFPLGNCYTLWIFSDFDC